MGTQGDGVGGRSCGGPGNEGQGEGVGMDEVRLFCMVGAEAVAAGACVMRENTGSPVDPDTPATVVCRFCWLFYPRVYVCVYATHAMSVKYNGA